MTDVRVDLDSALDLLVAWERARGAGFVVPSTFRSLAKTAYRHLYRTQTPPRSGTLEEIVLTLCESFGEDEVCDRIEERMREALNGER